MKMECYDHRVSVCIRCDVKLRLRFFIYEDFSVAQQSIQISNVIQCDPARLANFLGHCSQMNNKTNQKLETIYENLPTPQQIVRLGLI